MTTLRPEEQFDHLGTGGREVVGSAPIRLLDDDGNEVPDGEPGELYSSNPYRFQGYWNLPKQTADAFRGDCLSVGDIAFFQLAISHFATPTATYGSLTARRP